MTLANKITVLRILAVPCFVIALVEHHWRLAQVLFIASVFSDALDGAIARLRGERTPLGTFLDPMADKFLLLAATVTLTYLGYLPLWVFVVVLSRDVLIIMGWLLVYLLTANRRIEPRPLGKVTTTVQMATVIAILLRFPEPFTHGLIMAMTAANIVSALDYIWIGNVRLGAVEP